jgi:hypothetical protein
MLLVDRPSPEGAAMSLDCDTKRIVCREGHHGLMTSSATHATLATFRMDLSCESEQREALERFIVPGVQSFPGFVDGHWTLDRDASESLVLLTYETRASAEAMTENIIGNADNQRAAGLDLIGVRILEIAASATSSAL